MRQDLQLDPLQLNALVVDGITSSAAELCENLSATTRHVRTLFKADGLDAARDFLRKHKEVNCIFIDPLEFGLGPASAFVFQIRENHPTIVFCITTDRTKAESNPQFYTGERLRWRHYHTFDKNSPFYRQDLHYVLRNCRAYLRSNAYSRILRVQKIVDDFSLEKPEKQPKEIAMLEIVPLLEAVAAALSIAADAPGGLQNLKRFGVSAGLLKQSEKAASPTAEILEGPLADLTEGLTSDLKRLTSEYNARKNTWDQKVREDHQKRVAAQAHQLLEDGRPILEGSVKGYDKLLAFFGTVAKT
jgi:hypothetical protein